MLIQPVNTPPIEAHAKPVILSNIQWLGRQISTFGKTLYSQLTKITYLFYQTIKTHPKKTLAISAGATTTLLIYYKGKTLVTFLKSLNKESKEKTLQRTMNTLSEKFSKESEKLERQFFVLEKTVQGIPTAQKIINDSINDKQLQITTQYKEIKEAYKKLIECKSHANTLPKEKISLLETNIKSLSALDQRIAQLITETNNYKTHLSHVSNPFEP